jgi:hypothetical protein
VPLLPVRVPDISLDRNKGFEHWEMLSEEASRSHGDEIYCITTGIKSVSGQRQMLWAGPTEAPPNFNGGGTITTLRPIGTYCNHLTMHN